MARKKSIPLSCSGRDLDTTKLLLEFHSFLFVINQTCLVSGPQIPPPAAAAIRHHLPRRDTCLELPVKQFFSVEVMNKHWSDVVS